MGTRTRLASFCIGITAMFLTATGTVAADSEHGVDGYLLRASVDRSEEAGRDWENPVELIAFAKPASVSAPAAASAPAPEAAPAPSPTTGIPSSYPQTAEGENYYNFREEHGLWQPTADWSCGGNPLGGDWHAVHGGQYNYIAGYENATEAQRAAEFCEKLARSEDKIYAAWADLNQRVDAYYNMWNWDGPRSKRNWWKYNWAHWNYVVGRVDYKMSVEVSASLNIPYSDGVVWFEGITDEYVQDAYATNIRQHSPGIDLVEYFSTGAEHCEIDEEAAGPEYRDVILDMECDYPLRPGPREMAHVGLGPAEAHEIYVRVYLDEITIGYDYSTWGWD